MPDKKLSAARAVILKKSCPDLTEVDGILGYYEEKEGKTFFTTIGRTMTLEKVKINLEDNRVILQLSWIYQGKKVTRDVARSDLHRTKVQQFAALGADVFEHTLKFYIFHILNQEIRALHENIHTSLGWAKYDGKCIYKCSKAIGVESRYEGGQAISPKGTFGGWVDLVRQHALGHTPLEVGIVFGLSAVLAGYLAHDIDVGCLLIHINGNSTQGKTTVCQLAVSTAGYPDTSQDGLMNTWNGTINAITGTLRGNHGLPVVFDEASVSNSSDFSSFVYTLAGGKDKARLDKESNLQQSGTWSTTIISNGEHALSIKTNRNIGVKMRLTEYSNVSWTKNAPHAEAIKAGIREHHGHAAPKLAQTILEKGKSAVLAEFKRHKDTLLQSMPSDPFRDRRANTLAVLMLTAALSREALGLDLDLEAIQGFLLEHEAAPESRDLFTDAYEHLLEQVTKHQEHFDKEWADDISPFAATARGELWGNIIFGKVQKDKAGRSVKPMEVILLRSQFEKLMTDGKFADHHTILRQWKVDGRLDCEKDKLYRKRKLRTGGLQKVYVIKYLVPAEEPSTTEKVVSKTSPFEMDLRFDGD